ncbi:MAG TPA: excinuclease ABC subunit UvrA [Bacillota bacterium]|nr:excinuclease ABC subunit UvrA [Bacillota bacterium]HOL09257.1 excinuclease ABC subunit UvrA [Bacillota bacterium]HPO96920.1 excinuclease ABC subunit UvrA [Bacillota bacterium]
MAHNLIRIKGAREHNLKNVDLEIPRDQLVVFTGLSGSGKSSLAFDTIYAEGQRRYVESLSAYARQFLGQMDKPDVDYIEGLSPAISIDQKTTSHNPRSTVGTVTEIYDYLRLLFSRIGQPHCPDCNQPITQQTVEQIVDQVMQLPEGTKFQVLAPVVRRRKGEYDKLFEDLRRDGFVRVRVNGEIRDLSETITLERYKQHTIEVVVDRLILKPGIEQRLADSLEIALKLAKGLVTIVTNDGTESVYSEKFACPDCGFSFEELAPRMFSFNSPFGACPDCSGLGFKMEIDPELIIDKEKSLNQGAVKFWSSDQDSWSLQYLLAVAKHFKLDPDQPLKNATKEQLDVLLFGSKGEKIEIIYQSHNRELKHFAVFEGVARNLERRFHETNSEFIRREIQRFMTVNPCESCKGTRLKKESLSVYINGLNISQVTQLSVLDAKEFFNHLKLTEREQIIAKQVLKEINARLGFLLDVGLDYLTLDRTAGTLSGGEAQRIRLATQIGSSLVGVLYILDEPSIGLHQRDNERLLNTLKGLRDLGNTVIVVEHDEEMIREADFIVDIGPGAGVHGGEIVAAGDLATIMAEPNSITGRYLSGKSFIPVPDKRRKPNGKSIEIIGAKEHNLKKINVKIPLGVLTCVTGVSGSGKSTLINEILYPVAATKLNKATTLKAGAHEKIVGLEHLDKIIDIDQAPIGRTPRSNPATYTGVFDPIWQLFAETPEAKMRGYTASRFSFNVKGGRCEACSGDGIIKIEMHFLPDVYVPCEVCKGKRYNRETLEVKYKGKTIAEVLEMTVEEALNFFHSIPKIKRKLQALHDVGLDYIKLGQPATTLSGGEAQRVKLATELARKSTGKTLYILDEPTTGLHFADTHKLLEMLQRLVDGGDTVLVIEHNLDIIKAADYLIDLGPEGGIRGGEVVISGTPEEVAACPNSHTGRFLAPLLKAKVSKTKKCEQALV